VIRVLIADDNVVVRRGVVSLLESSGGIEVVGEASTGKQAVELSREVKPDVVLLDVRMPVMDGVAAAARLSEKHKVMMLTYSEEQDVVSGAIRAGAAGYLVHGRFTAEDLERSVKELAAGEKVLSPSVVTAVFEAVRSGGPESEAGSPHHLTEREQEVMNLLAQGLPNRDIAKRLFLSEKTVKNHINRTYAKLGVGTRAEAIATWLGVKREAGN
jgi:DNA-binding NarL/FixJ family response regulator